MHKLYYLASPYSHSDVTVRNMRADQAAQAAAILKRNGYHVFAPIPHGHMMVPHGLPGGYEEFWKPYCRNIISRVDVLLVLTLDGWKDSVGVQDEIAVAEELHLPVIPLSLTNLVNNKVTL